MYAKAIIIKMVSKISMCSFYENVGNVFGWRFDLLWCINMNRCYYSNSASPLLNTNTTTTIEHIAYTRYWCIIIKIKLAISVNWKKWKGEERIDSIRLSRWLNGVRCITFQITIESGKSYSISLWTSFWAKVSSRTYSALMAVLQTTPDCR